MEENKNQDIPEAGKEKQELDIDAILLPKKEVRTSASAQRINAGVLLEQEQNATLLPPKEASQTSSGGSSLEKVLGGPRSAGQEGTELAPDFSSKTSASDNNVPSLQTYKDDIQKLLQKDKVSVVTIAAAEAGRRSAVPGATVAKTSGMHLTTWLLTIVGILFTLGGLTLVVYFFAPARSVPVEQTLPAPFIAVDSTTIVNFAPNSTRNLVMGGLQDSKTNTALSLGLVGRLLPVATDADGTQTAMDAQTFLQLLAPNLPVDLLRTIQPTFLLGVHIFDVTQPFLILRVDSYEQAYSGMLAWEGSMRQDLLPLFDYTPRIHIPEENLATSTATTTLAQQSPLGDATFVDRIVLNHDARVLQNNTGDIYFLWTFLDRNTLVITTQENTLKEIISRATEAPLVSLPQ